MDAGKRLAGCGAGLKEAVAAVLNGAKPYPVQGLYRLADYPETEPVRTFSTGWPTGVPGEGKSTFAINFACNMAKLHGWS